MKRPLGSLVGSTSRSFAAAACALAILRFRPRALGAGFGLGVLALTLGSAATNAGEAPAYAGEAPSGTGFALDAAHRIIVPNVAADGRFTLDVGDPILVPTLHYTVIIQVEARDAEPEACCLDRWTQLQVSSEGVLYKTREPGLTVRLMTDPYPDSGGVDLEGCKWTRVFTERSFGIRIGRTDDVVAIGSELVVMEVDGPEWFYSISGCRDLADARTEPRSLGEYMKAAFPGYLSLGGNYFAFDAPLALSRPQCVRNIGGDKGQAADVEVSITIFIWEAPCSIPIPPFPFRVPPRFN